MSYISTLFHAIDIQLESNDIHALHSGDRARKFRGTIFFDGIQFRLIFSNIMFPGYPLRSLAGSTPMKISIRSGLTFEQWRAYVWASFPKLKGKPFMMMTQDRSKNLTKVQPNLPATVRKHRKGTSNHYFGPITVSFIMKRSMLPGIA